MKIKDALLRLQCLFFGHDTYRVRWANVYRCCRNRKGGKRRGKGVYLYRVKHHEDYCRRCGKLIKRK